MNRGGATPAKTPLKDGGNPVELGRATKSGRKVKRPAHFDDSPDAKKAGSRSVEEDSPKRKVEVPEVAKKFARKTILVKGGEDSPKSNGGGESALEPAKKSARKTLVKHEDSREEQPEKAQKIASRRTITPANSKEESPEPKPVKESARKTLLKSAVKSSSSVEQQDTPKKDKPTKTESPKKSVKKAEPVEEETPAGAGISRTGRKIKVPAHLKEFDDVVVASPKKEPAPVEKSASRKSLAPVVRKLEPEEEKLAPKTPGRGRSLAVGSRSKAAEPEQEGTKESAKTPRRGKSLTAKMDADEDPLAIPPSPEVASPKKRGNAPQLAAKSSPVKAVVEAPKVADLASKTPKRGKSLAPPVVSKSPVSEEKLPAKTPSKRAKSIAATPVRVASPERAPKTPKVTRLVEDSAEPVSRSGRKIKPKKYFGEFEEDESEPVIAKVTSPVKAVVKSAVVTKVASPVKAAVKSVAVAKFASPVKAIAKGSPVAKKMSPPKKVSPVKRHQVPEKADESPRKKAKLEPKPVKEEAKKIDDISPNTEERLITKRGVNDHHHQQQVKEETSAKVETAKKTSEKKVDPDSEIEEKKHVEEEKPKRSRKTLSASSSTETPPDPEKSAAEPQEQPKRGRKTLPAPSDEAPEEEQPKASKTTESEKLAEEETQEKPKRGRKTLPASSDETAEEEPPKAPKTPVARRQTTAAVTAATEDVGSSRSGRKIKPKKFFGEEEEPPKAAAVKPKASTSGPVVNGGGRGKRKTLIAELDKEVDEPKKALVEDVKQAPKAEVEKCPSREEILAVVGAIDPVEEMMEELHTDSQESIRKHDNDDDDEQPILIAQEDTPQEAAASGNVQESTEVDNLLKELDTPSPAVEDVLMSADDEVPAVQPVPEAEIQPIEPVAEESRQEPDPADEEESTLQEPETVESALEENFQEASVPQTSPAPCPPTEEVPIDPAPLPEDPPLVEHSLPEEETPLKEPTVSEELPTTTEPVEQVQSMPDPDPQQQPELMTEDPEPSGNIPDLLVAVETKQERTEPIPLAESANQPSELSASSSFSETLLVEEDPAEQSSTVADDSKGQQYESVEFLELSGASTAGNEHPVGAAPLESKNNQEQEQQQQQAEDQLQNRQATPELEDDLDNTEIPPMEDIDDEQEEQLLEDVPEPTDESFLERDRDNESIIVIPDTPKPPPSELPEDLDAHDKAPSPQTSHAPTARLELPSSPVIQKELVPSTPRTPESKAPSKATTCSPDKPEDQEQANVPQDEVIEISDSPIAVVKSEHTDGATSTPLRTGSKMSVKDRLIENSRKRSLSVDSDLVKKNVTFHSPANSTILVDTLDERLKKKNESATKTPHGHRKRSFSEHKDPRHAQNDGPKPAKMSKLPNFKNIHQQQFNRMESIEEFHNRKVQRAKDILASSTVKSPAAMALVKGDRPLLHKSSSVPAPKSPHKTENGTTSGIARSHTIPKSTNLHKPLSDAERQEKRQKQFQASFKPGSSSTEKDIPDASRRVIEQSRHKQSQILKGVRTNKRFELLMKFRDAQE